MFSITCRSDVIEIARTFGPEALRHVIKFGTLGPEVSKIIHDCFCWAGSRTITINEVNDGNRNYELFAKFESVVLNGVHFSGLADITIIQTGFGSFSVSVEEAMQKGYITPDQLRMVLSVVSDRQKAREVLWK